MGPATSPTATKPTPKPRAMSIITTAADRTAAARAASAAKRAAAKSAKATTENASMPATSPIAPIGSAEDDVKKERQSDAEGIEEDTKIDEVEEEEEEDPEEKVIKRRKPGKKRRSVVKRRQSVKKSTVQQDEEDKDETSDDISTVESEATAPTAAEEDVSDMDIDMEVDVDVEMEVDGTPTPKGRVLSKRKRQGSTPPPTEAATPIPTASPRLSVTSLAPPPPPLVQQKSDAASTSSSSSLSQIIAPSPSPVSFLPPRPVSTVGQQVQVIATKKFQQLSAPLLHNISAHRFANLFMAPVGERVAPGYSRLVYRPMDLKSMLTSYRFISFIKF